MSDINMEVLERVSEGESNAQLMSKCIETIQEQFPDDTLPSLIDRISDLWANQLSTFFPDDGEMTIEEHWNNNYQWGVDILESYFDETS